MSILIPITELGVLQDTETLKTYNPDIAAYEDCDSALVHDGGVWREVWPEKTYLIKDGVDRTTGGWKWIRLVGAPAESWMLGYLQLINTYQNGSTNWYITDMPVNLMGKSRLCITMDAQGPGNVSRYIGLFNGNTFPANDVDGTFYATHAFKDSFARTTICIDFVPVTGKYVGFGVGTIGGTTVYRIYDVWLE